MRGFGAGVEIHVVDEEGGFVALGLPAAIG